MFNPSILSHDPQQKTIIEQRQRLWFTKNHMSVPEKAPLTHMDTLINLGLHGEIGIMVSSFPSLLDFTVS